MNSETGTPINAELVHWSGPHGLPRFDLISVDDFAPAFDAALAEAEAAHEAIAGNPAAPDFANTVAAMEKADEALGRVASVFYTLAGLCSNDRREALQRALAPRLAEKQSCHWIAAMQKELRVWRLILPGNDGR